MKLYMERICAKMHLYLLSIVGILVLTLAPAKAAVTAPKKLSDGAQFTVDGGTLRIQFWSPEIVRVTYAPGAELPEQKSLSVVATSASVRLTRKENKTCRQRLAKLSYCHMTVLNGLC